MGSKPESTPSESKTPKLIEMWDSRLERIKRKKEEEEKEEKKEIENFISEIHQKIKNILEADQCLGLDTDDDEDDLDSIYSDTFSFVFMSNELSKVTSKFECIQKHFRENEGLNLTWDVDSMKITVTRIHPY